MSKAVVQKHKVLDLYLTLWFLIILFYEKWQNCSILSGYINIIIFVIIFYVYWTFYIFNICKYFNYCDYFFDQCKPWLTQIGQDKEYDSHNDDRIKYIIFLMLIWGTEPPSWFQVFGLQAGHSKTIFLMLIWGTEPPSWFQVFGLQAGHSKTIYYTYWNW